MTDENGETALPRVSVNDVSDFIVIHLASSRHRLTLLKLHKLVYYCQAWSLALGEGCLFDNDLQAWVHGPVSRVLYDRYRDEKTMYSSVSCDDARADFDEDVIPAERRGTILAVLEKYGAFTGDQLEGLTHQEQPWREARVGLASGARCQTVISESSMQAFYSARLENE